MNRSASSDVNYLLWYRENNPVSQEMELIWSTGTSRSTCWMITTRTSSRGPPSSKTGDGPEVPSSVSELYCQSNLQLSGVLMMGYELYRQLSNKKSRKRKGKNHQTGCDFEQKSESSALHDIQKYLVNPGPDLVICDEGHRIKNSHASISQVRN